MNLVNVFFRTLESDITTDLLSHDSPGWFQLLDVSKYSREKRLDELLSFSLRIMYRDAMAKTMPRALVSLFLSVVVNEV